MTTDTTDSVDEINASQSDESQSLTTIANLQAEIDSLRKESANYRVQRNTALKQSKAYQTVIQSHNIRFSLDEADLTGLSVDDGAIVGEFEYTPNAPQTSASDQDMGNAPNPLTMDDVREMGEKEINERWDEISALMSQQR